jgi:hypothetical protein
MHKIDYSIPNDSLDKTDGDQHSRIDENVPYRLRENLRFMKTNPNSTASLELSTNAAFAERVRVNQAKLTSELRPHYDFSVCGHFLHVSSAIIEKRRFLDKASMQPQQTSGHQTNIVQQVKSTGGEFYDQSNANKKHPNANTMLTESLQIELSSTKPD